MTWNPGAEPASTPEMKQLAMQSSPASFPDNLTVFLFMRNCGHYGFTVEFSGPSIGPPKKHSVSQSVWLSYMIWTRVNCQVCYEIRIWIVLTWGLSLAILLSTIDRFINMLYMPGNDMWF